MHALTKLPYSIRKINRIAKLYNKAFHAKVFTLFASSESEVYTLAQMYKPSYGFCMVFNENFEGPYFLDDEGIEKIRKSILNFAQKNPDKVFSIYQAWESDWEKYKKLSFRLLPKNLAKLSDQRLYDEFENFYEHYLKAGGLAYLCDSFMSSGKSDWMEVLLEKELVKAGVTKNLLDTIRLLTFPVEPSFALEEEYRFEKLIDLFQKKFGSKFPDLKKLKQNYPDLYDLLEKHERDYFWIQNNYFSVGYYGIAAIYLKIKEAHKENRLKRQNEPSILRIKRERLLRELSLPSSVINILNTAQLFAHWKDVRKSGVYMGMHHFDRFLAEIARRRKVDKLDLTFLVFYEIEDFFINRKSMQNMITSRKKKVFYSITPKGYYIAGGEHANKYFTIWKKTKSASVSELRGVCACAGIAKGQVRVIRNSTDMKLFRNGEILVTNQTTPDFVPIMRKASAIVTEQGGITSHAAVVSRELNKACLIGTKIATEVFRNGDLVEVNANHGWVRKIDN